MKNLTKSITELISAFENDLDVKLFQRRYEHKNVFEILGLVNNEKAYSAIIAWLFEGDNNPSLREEIVKRLTKLLIHRIFENDMSKCDDKALHVMHKGDYDISSVTIERERYIKKQQKKGFIDILLHCSIDFFDEGRKESRMVNIIIENKVFSNTANNQLHRYFEIITRRHKKDVNLFVILVPSQLQVKEEHNDYLILTYQDLVDNIIIPTLRFPNISTHARIILEDFLNALTTYNKNNKKIKLLAMDENDKKLLHSFYDKHNELITLMLNMLAEDPDIEDDLQVEVQKAANTLGRVNDNRVRYKIVGEDKIYGMTDIAEEVLKRFIEKNKNFSYEDLKAYFANRNELGCTSDFVNNDEFDGNHKRRHRRLNSIKVRDISGKLQDICVSTQWTKTSIKIFEQFVNNKLKEVIGITICQIL